VMSCGMNFNHLAIRVRLGDGFALLLEPFQMKLDGLSNELNNLQALSPTATQPGRSGTYAPQLTGPSSTMTVNSMSISYRLRPVCFST